MRLAPALRRVAFITAAQTVGLRLADIRSAVAGLHNQRTPYQADRQRLAGAWQPLIDARIAALQRLRNLRACCIGCGCLSLTAGALYNVRAKPRVSDGTTQRGQSLQRA